MIFRPYKDSDHSDVKEITIECFDHVSSIDHNIENQFGLIAGKDWKWRKGQEIERDLAANPGGVFISEVDGQPVGYITTRIDRETGIGVIPNLAVLSQYRNRGIARRLIDMAIQYMQQEGMSLVRIETLDTNDPGKRLYPSRGFREVARQIHFVLNLESPEDQNQSG